MLVLATTLFAFTLGVHYGKHVGGDSTPHGLTGQLASQATSKSESVAQTVEDLSPRVQDLVEPTSDAEVAEHLKDELHQEVQKAHLSLTDKRPIELPTQTLAESAQHPGQFTHFNPTYTLQLGSTSNRQEAQNQINTLKNLKLSPELKEIEIPGKGKWYKVYLGVFTTKHAANAAGVEYRAGHKIESYTIVNTPRE
ncbi:unnamed protein product [Sphagnum jensenii]|uniref:SPOR domain-containing protein n=1 Tax=Sphagnum jensenii TaxID=128206 RepID=A0ABP0VC56_9BRYO